MDDEDRAAARRADRAEAARRRLAKRGSLGRFKAACVGTPMERIHALGDAADVAMVPISIAAAAYGLATSWPSPGGWTWLAIAGVPASIGSLLWQPHVHLQRMVLGRMVKGRARAPGRGARGGRGAGAGPRR